MDIHRTMCADSTWTLFLYVHVMCSTKCLLTLLWATRTEQHWIIQLYVVFRSRREKLYNKLQAYHREHCKRHVVSCDVYELLALTKQEFRSHGMDFGKLPGNWLEDEFESNHRKRCTLEDPDIVDREFLLY